MVPSTVTGSYRSNTEHSWSVEIDWSQIIKSQWQRGAALHRARPGYSCNWNFALQPALNLILVRTVLHYACSMKMPLIGELHVANCNNKLIELPKVSKKIWREEYRNSFASEKKKKNIILLWIQFWMHWSSSQGTGTEEENDQKEKGDNPYSDFKPAVFAVMRGSSIFYL